MKRLLLLLLSAATMKLFPMEQMPSQPLISNAPSLKFLTAQKFIASNTKENLEKSKLPEELKQYALFMKEYRDTHAELTDPKKLHEDSQSMLWNACKHGMLDESLLNDLTARSNNTLTLDQDNESLSPLAIASGCGQHHVVELLLKYGAQVNKTSLQNQFTPLIVINRLSDKCTENHLTTMKLLLEHGAQVDAIDRQGNTALHHAAKRGHAQAIELLLTYGADVNKAAKNGATPLCITIEKTDISCMELLLKNKANVEFRGKHGQTPFEQCYDKQFMQGMELLKKCGANINILISGGLFTALHNAVLYKKIPMIKFLLQLGANPNSLCRDNETALITAIYTKDDSIVQLLLTYDANPNVTGRFHDTALRIALERKLFTIASLLLDYGATIPDRYSDLEEIIAAGNITLLKRLLDNGIHSWKKNEYIWQHLMEKAKDPDMIEFMKNYMPPSTSGCLIS